MEQQEVPAGWWDAEADRSLLAGVFKHGRFTLYSIGFVVSSSEDLIFIIIVKCLKLIRLLLIWNLSTLSSFFFFVI